MDIHLSPAIAIDAAQGTAVPQPVRRDQTLSNQLSQFLHMYRHNTAQDLFLSTSLNIKNLITVKIYKCSVVYVELYRA